VLAHLDTVVDLLLEQIREVLVKNLSDLVVTFIEPTVPQNPLGLNSCLLGSRSASLSSNPLARLRSCSQFLT
jgi:hypothetical protein